MSRFMPIKDKIVLKPRTVRIDNDHGVVTSPKLFGKARAEELKRLAEEAAKDYVKRVGFGCWRDCIHDVMTNEEVAYVLCVWEAIPDDASCFVDAFQAILNGWTE